jgi:Ca2+/Na+ antiporter
MHQVVEYLIGLGLISVSFQSPTPAIPAVMGVAIILNAAVTTGAAGAFRLLHRNVHKWIDVVLMLLLVMMAVQWWADVDAAGRLLMAAVCVVMAFVWFHSDFDDKAARKQRTQADARPTSEDIGRQAGRLVGDGYNAVKRMRAKGEEPSSPSAGDP